MNFGKVLEALKAGKKVARAGWNGKGLNDPPKMAGRSTVAEDYVRK